MFCRLFNYCPNMSPSDLIALAYACWHSRTGFRLLVIITPKSFFSFTVYNLLLFMIIKFVVFFPRCKTTHLSVLNGINHFSDHSTRQDRSLWMTALSTSVFTIPKSLVSSANFSVELISVESRSLMKTRNKTGPNTEPCGTPLVTAFQEDLELSLQTI